MHATAPTTQMEYALSSFHRAYKLYAPPKPLPPLYSFETDAEAQARAEEERREAVWRATLDPTTPLLMPHFHKQDRVAALVLPRSVEETTTSADIRLLSARKLVAYIDGGGRMSIRQKLEAAGTDLYVDAATVRKLLPELETKDDECCTFSSVVALSYAWVTPADPDPERAQLLQLRNVLVWWICERARRKLLPVGYTHEPDATMQTADFGVFIDFMCMHQPDNLSGAAPAYTKPAEQESFGRALRNIGLLYGHAGTVVFKLTATPLPTGGDPDRVYSRRGWTHLERRLGDLEAPLTNSLDLARWKLEPPPDRLDSHGIPKNPGRLKSEENARCKVLQLYNERSEAYEGEHVTIGFLPGPLGALIRDGGRGAPVSPAHFEEELKEKVFSYETDRKTCAGLYRGVAEPLLAGVETLTFNELAWTAADWRHMGGVLACCTKLRKLNLTRMNADDAAIAAFGGALVSGAAPALEVLDLAGGTGENINRIGDEGMRHLSDALARGAAPALEVLSLKGNREIGDRGVRHLRDALASGAAPALKELMVNGWASLHGDLLVRFFADAEELSCGGGVFAGGNGLGFGDDEARRLAAALEHATAHGALKALKRLDIGKNRIGDEGARHLADALARGAAPVLDRLNIYGNPASVQDVLEQRRKRNLLDGAFFVTHLADAKELHCGGLDWGDDEVRGFAAAVEHAHAQGALKALEGLILIDNKIGDEGLRHLVDALARGAAPALKTLSLYGNRIGDEGLRYLGDALVRGAAPALKELKFDEMRAQFRSPAAWRFLVKHRCLPEELLDGAFLVARFADATLLDCKSFGWGDDEARRLAAALEHATAHGALKALKRLDISCNRIGDDGGRHLADALARGAAPALEWVDVYGNPVLQACTAVLDALELRGTCVRRPRW